MSATWGRVSRLFYGYGASLIASWLAIVVKTGLVSAITSKPHAALAIGGILMMVLGTLTNGSMLPRHQRLLCNIGQWLIALLVVLFAWCALTIRRTREQEYLRNLFALMTVVSGFALMLVFPAAYQASKDEEDTEMAPERPKQE